jgi:alpha-galactosidase
MTDCAGDALTACSNWLRAALSSANGPAWELGPGPPFSFQLGDAPASELLAHWHVTAATDDVPGIGSRQIACFDDPASGFRVEYVCTAYARYPALELLLYLTNRGSGDTPLVSHVRPLDVSFIVPATQPVTLHAFRGGVAEAEAYAPYRRAVNEGDAVRLGGKGGRSSGEFLPWLNTQVPGGGLLTVVGWSGQWEAEINRAAHLRLRAGMEGLNCVLRGGEKIRSPRILLLAWEGDAAINGFNAGRRLFIDQYAPRLDGDVILPPIAKLTPYDEIDLNTWTSRHGEENQLQAIHEAAALGVEAYWLDAYWFDGYYPRGLGNWQFPVERTVRETFPRGLRPLADAAHRAGMQFILWFAPEVFAPDTYIDRHKAEWTLRLSGVEGGLFNLGVPEARQWMTKYIVDSLQTFDADVCRMDLTREPLEFWRAADTPTREGMTEIHYVEGLYQMWDDILSARPGAWIDNCATGGQRIDLETCTRALPLWRSDFNDTPRRQHDEIGAITDQAMVMGLSHCVPFHAGPVWRPQPYYWRSAMAAGMNIYWDLRPDRTTGTYTYDRELTRKAIEECKALRPFFRGDFYPLTDINTRPDAWAAYEYVSDDGGFALFFRRPESPVSRVAVRLCGLEIDRRYRVEWRWDYDTAVTRVVTGAEFAHFEAEIAHAPGSLLVQFTPA